MDSGSKSSAASKRLQLGLPVIGCHRQSNKIKASPAKVGLAFFVALDYGANWKRKLIQQTSGAVPVIEFRICRRSARSHYLETKSKPLSDFNRLHSKRA